MAVKDRARHHRANRQQQNLRRLDVWIRQSTMTETRRIAGAMEPTVWSVVEIALKGYIAEYRAILAEGKRLRQQRDYLLPFQNEPEHQDLIRTHQQQVAAYRKSFRSVSRSSSAHEWRRKNLVTGNAKSHDVRSESREKTGRGSNGKNGTSPRA